MKTTKGMKEATVWKLCIEMWDWIAEQIRAGSKRKIWELKDQWCGENGYTLENSCFFCDYQERHPKQGDGISCHGCPGYMIAPRFDCFDGAYSFVSEPLKFHAKLHRMNKERLRRSK